MDVKITNSQEFGFKWNISDGVFVKGYFFDNKNNYYYGEKLLQYFKSIDNNKEFYEKIININGIFSVIIKKETKLFAASDVVRMFPLFYTKIDNTFIISDKITKVKNGNKDQLSINEILMTGFVVGKNTIYENTKQIQAGELITVDDNIIETTTYQDYITSENNILKQSFEQLHNIATKKINNVAKRLINSLNGKTAIIPLSGGYDSRLIAVMLKNAGYKKVICFTYGSKMAKDIPISKNVAKTLGFKWHYIEYNKQIYSNFLKTEIYNNFFYYSSQEVTLPFFQEYFAVKYLKDNNLIPNDSVFIPGHVGDNIGGSNLDLSHSKLNNSIKNVRHSIFNKYYSLNKVSVSSKKQVRNNLEIQLNNFINSDEIKLPYSIIENWNFKEKQSKFTTNYSNVYNYFGYEHRLPFWDKELIDFFKIVPFKYRLYKNLYNKVLNESFFSKYQLNFKTELQPTESQIKRQVIKNKIKKYFPTFYKKKRVKKANWLNSNLILNQLEDDLIERGNKFNYNIQNGNSLAIQWFVEIIKKS